MTSIIVQPNQTEIKSLLHSLKDSNEPLLLTSGEVNAVLVTEEEWNGLQETLYLLSIPGMKESILEGMKEPWQECSEEKLFSL